MEADKIPIKNIYYMLCYAWDKIEEKEIVNVSSIEHTRLVDLFAKVLVNGLGHLMKKGIDRGYITYFEDARTLRGKLDLNVSIKRGLLNKRNVHCQYDELHYDILHNQIIKTILRQLANHPDLENGLRGEVLGLYRRLHGISEIHLTSSVFGKVQLSRNNYFYDFLLKICELLHGNLLITEEVGESKFRGLQTRLFDLFERFIRNFYIRELELKGIPCKVMREDISWDVGEGLPAALKYLPKMQTDVSIEFENRKIILDAKFYKNAMQNNQEYGSSKLISNNLYQIFAYVKNIETKKGLNSACEGILIYPKTKDPLDLEYRIQGHLVSVKTLDLNQDWQQIHKRLFAIIGEETNSN